MTESNTHTFDCQMYVSKHLRMSYALPEESAPRRVIRFAPVEYDELIAPDFRRLIAAFESVPRPLTFVQVS